MNKQKHPTMYNNNNNKNKTQIKNYETNYEKNPPKVSLSSFCVGHLFMGRSPSLSVVCILSETLLENIFFSVVSSCQLEIACE